MNPARTPAFKFGLIVLLGALLAVPLFSVYLLVYDRQSQSDTARAGIVAGWGDRQTVSGPFLIIPFTRVEQVTSTEAGKTVTRQKLNDESLVVSPTQVAIDTRLDPELRKVSIYEAVIYTANMHMQGGFTLPDLAALNIDPGWVHFDQMRIALGIDNSRGLAGSQPNVAVNGKTLPLIPGSGLNQNSGNGFSAMLPVAPARGLPLPFDISFQLRGHDTITVVPSAQDTRWHVSSVWPNPSFLGGFLPASRKVTPQGFEADWQIGNLALNRPTVSIGEQQPNSDAQVSVALIDTVDFYSQVSRAAKYGFLFIGFTFVALLMFDILFGVNVPGPAYLLVGVGLILFFVLLLAFAEVIGFSLAYLVASGAIVALLSCYSAAILKSWRRSIVIAAMLSALYVVLYVLLSLEAWSLMIGSLLIFAALAAVMYITRNVNWRQIEQPTATDANLAE
ncbi:cell envelope integrity protein CreD [Paraburkholderia dinghuensis]|uniref:Cell envelope integrity protein CreD n=2 Tax=Paraburkholderia dinghuensis TaxID=2305225 RepID=A0A3N6NA07_9BURK|nr:cell envelope integrity protein CreD [Paraburkholderia dinghuensis]